MFYVGIFIVIAIFYYKTFGTETAHSRVWLFAIIMFLGLVVGMGDMLGGYDRYIYAELFDRCTDFISQGLSPWTDDNPIYNSYYSEMAYVVWNVIIAHVTENRYIYILITTLVMFLMIYKSLADYIEDNYFFAVLVFLGIWFFFSHTYLRQACATCVAWYSMRFVIARKPIPFFICAFIAWKFHNSAIVFAPIYFLPLKKWSKGQIITTMSILFIIGVTGATSALYSWYGGLDPENDRNHGYEADDTGGRLAYLLEAVVFLYFILRKYDLITTKKDLVFLNAALCFCGMLLFFFRSSNAGRQSWYFAIGFIYLFTKLATHQTEHNRFERWSLILFFALFLRIVIAWGPLLSPYKSFLTSGIRPEDPVVQQYEYDWNYADDKMYRKPIRIITGDWK